MDEGLAVAKGKLILTAEADDVGKILLRGGAVAVGAVIVLELRADEVVANVVEDLAVGVGEQNSETLRKAVLDRQLEGMVGGLTDGRGARHVQELRMRTEELTILHGGRAERRGTVGDDAEEWIGDGREQP